MKALTKNTYIILLLRLSAPVHPALMAYYVIKTQLKSEKRNKLFGLPLLVQGA